MQYTETVRFKALEFAMGLTGANCVDSTLELAKAIESFTQFGDEDNILRKAALSAARMVAIRQGAENTPEILIANATIFFEYLRPSTSSNTQSAELLPEHIAHASMPTRNEVANALLKASGLPISRLGPDHGDPEPFQQESPDRPRSPSDPACAVLDGLRRNAEVPQCPVPAFRATPETPE